MNNNKKKASLASAAVIHYFQQSQKTLLSAATITAYSSDNSDVLPRGRFKRDGSIPAVRDSVWSRTDRLGDDLEFLHFTSLTRQSFEDLVALCGRYIFSHPINQQKGNNSYKKHCRPQGRLFMPRDVVAMGLKCLLSVAENKDIRVQFASYKSVSRYPRCCRYDGRRQTPQSETIQSYIAK